MNDRKPNRDKLNEKIESLAREVFVQLVASKKPGMSLANDAKQAYDAAAAFYEYTEKREG